MATNKAIKEFPKQFGYEPVIENAEALGYDKHVISVGMGGSHLASDLLTMAYRDMDIMVHSDYGLPFVSSDFLRESLVVCNSHSGNTEETIDAFNTAEKRGALLAVIASGGKLLARAKEKGVAYIQLPNSTIQPRLAVGLHLRALMKMLSMEDALVETAKLQETLDVKEAEKKGTALAKKLEGKIPVIYASRHNEAIAYNWKIKLNETGKIPAFYNIFPELNHNEMTGFDIAEKTKSLSEKFHFIFLKDVADHPKIQKRMDVCKKLYEARGFAVETVESQGATIWNKIFSSLLVADVTAFHIADMYGVESEAVPMVEEFKKMI
ncbi:MAG: bifunctional phosphoglucose/phosphomannose isomerase [bacterium]|nr:bifunctional phosphoglucose/phosphomannose isomerase [bacterium]